MPSESRAPRVTAHAAALLQQIGILHNPYFRDLERRAPQRHACSLEATSHPLEHGDTLSWGIRRAWLLPDGAAEDQPSAAVAPG